MVEDDDTAGNTAGEASQEAPANGAASNDATSNAAVRPDHADANGPDNGTPNSNAPRTGSSATSDTTLQTAQNGQPGQPQTPEEWRDRLQSMEKRYSDLRGHENKQTQHLQRIQREFQEMQSRYQGIDPQEIARYRQSQQEAARRDLKRWDPRHPDHHKFQGTLTKRDALNSQIGKLRNRTDITPEQKQALELELVESALSPEEQTELRDHGVMNREFMLNPLANSRAIAREEAREAFREMWQQETQRTQAEQSVQRDLANPVLAELAADPRMNERMTAIMQGLSNRQLSPWQIAKHVALLESQLGSLQSRVGEADNAKSQASEQQRLLQSGASHTRDSVMSPKRDIYREARRLADKEGLPHGHPRFLKILRDLEKGGAG